MASYYSAAQALQDLHDDPSILQSPERMWLLLQRLECEQYTCGVRSCELSHPEEWEEDRCHD